MELIDREALLRAYDAEHKGPAGRARELIEEAPTVDAVEVVRCKDCVNYHNDGEAEGIGWCDVHSRVDGLGEWDIFEPNDFCSDGERRTE